MEKYRRLAESDFRLMNIIWNNEPVGSMQLVDICLKELGWKKSTTFTMLRKMCTKGLAKNEISVVTSIVPRSEIQRAESDFFVKQVFSGSLPSFVVSFMDGKKITEKEAEELKRLIDEHREEK